MANVVDITGLPPERIIFSPSPLAELGAALHVLSEPGHHPGLHGWATATAASLKPDLADRLCEADFLWRTARSDLLLPSAPGATLAEDLDALDRIDDEAFVAAAFEINCSASYDRPTPSPLVDRGERDRVRDMARARGPRQLAFVDRMLVAPDGLRVWLRRLLEDCDQAFFADTWRRVRFQLAADARHKGELLQRKGLAEALTAISAALSLEQGADGRSRILVDKLAAGRTTASRDGLTLIPTAFGWPHLLLVHAPGWRPVIQYPVAGPELAPPAVLELVQHRLEALAHPMRMRICRTLARGPHTTGELAEAYAITPPEVSRHIAVMKKAGLLQTRRRGRYVLHQLDLAAVARLGSDFIEGVLR
jgi:DNA-binding transcriptional ArsR family regulator